MPRQKNVIAPNDDRSVVAMGKMSAQIERARVLYGDGQPFEEERILDCIVFRAERADHEIEALGKYCLWLKTEVGYGRFVEGLKRRDIDVGGAYYAMAMVEKFGAEFRTVRNLGTRKARLLTRFTKEEIDTYVQGGPLKDIPHDAVAKRTFTELETEVRRLQKKLDGQKDRHEKELAEKKNEIEHLQEIVDLRVPLSKEEEAAKRAQTELQKLTVDYTFALGKVNSSLREAFALVAKAEKIEGVNVQQLNDWIRQFDMEMDNFNTLKDGWTAEIENVGPMPDWRLSDLK